MLSDDKMIESQLPDNSLEMYCKVVKLRHELVESEQLAERYMDSLEEKRQSCRQKLKQHVREREELKLVEKQIMEERKSLVEEMEGLTNMENMTKRERSKKKNRKKYNWKRSKNKNLQIKLDELNMEKTEVLKRKEAAEKLILKEEDTEFDLWEQIEGASDEYERCYKARVENDMLCERVPKIAEEKLEVIDREWVRSFYLLPPMKRVVKWVESEKGLEKQDQEIRGVTQNGSPESLWNSDNEIQRKTESCENKNLKIAQDLKIPVSWKYMWDLEIIPSFIIRLSRETVKIVEINREEISENVNWNLVEYFESNQTEPVIEKQKIQEDLERDDKYNVREVIKSLKMESLEIVDKEVKRMSDSETGYESKITSEEEQTTSCEEETEIEERSDEIYKKRRKPGKLKKKAKRKKVASNLKFLSNQKILSANMKIKKCLQKEKDQKVKENKEYKLKIESLENTVRKLEGELIENKNVNLEKQREDLEDKHRGEINKIRRSVIEKVNTEKLNKFVSMKNQLFSLIDKYKEESLIGENILENLKFNLLKEDKELVKALLGIFESFGENKKTLEEKERKLNNLKDDLENLKKNNLEDLEKLKNKMEKEILIVKTKVRNWKNLYGDMKVSHYNGVNFLYGKIQKLREECEQLKYNISKTNSHARERQEWNNKVTVLENKNKEMENNMRREREEKIRMETEIISKDQNFNDLEIQIKSLGDRCVRLDNLYQHQKRLYVAANKLVKNFKERDQLRSTNQNVDRKDGEISKVREDLKATRKSLEEKIEEIKKIKMNWENSKEGNEKYKNKLKARIEELQKENLEKNENIVSEEEIGRLKMVEKDFSEWHDNVIRDLDFFNNWIRKIENKFCNGRELLIREDLGKFSNFINEELCRYFPHKIQRVRTVTAEENKEQRKPESEVEKLRKRLKLVKPGSKDFLRLSLKIKDLEEENEHQCLRLGNIC